MTPCLEPDVERLRRCLESVSRQSYPGVEHVVVDGGSSGTVIAALAPADVRLVSEPDDGQADALAKGFRLATGSILGWVNADDVLGLETALAVVQALRRSPAAGWAYGDCEVFSPSWRGVWKPCRRYTQRRIAAGEVVPQPGSFFTREAYERVGGLDPSFHLAMDVDLFIRLVDAGYPGVYVPHTLARFEIHEGSKTGAQRRGRFLEEHARALEKSGRRRAAAVLRGRAAAVDSVGHGGAIDQAALDAGVAAAVLVTPPSLRQAVVSGAAAEAAVLDVRGNTVRGLRRLLAVSPWRYPETRSRLLAAARRSVRPGRPGPM